MGKLVAIVAIALAVLLYVHTRSANAAKVATCLEHAGATVSHSTYLEDAFGVTSDGQQIPSGLRNELKRADRQMYDVSLSGDQGLLMVTGTGYSARQVEQASATAQGRGRIVMLWYGEPSAASRSTLEHCLH